VHSASINSVNEIPSLFRKNRFSALINALGAIGYQGSKKYKLLCCGLLSVVGSQWLPSIQQLDKKG
jgi:hypothetical protein